MWELTLEIKDKYIKVPFEYKKLKDAVDFVEEVMDQYAGNEEIVFHITKKKVEPVATTEGE